MMAGLKFIMSCRDFHDDKSRFYYGYSFMVKVLVMKYNCFGYVLEYKGGIKSSSFHGQLPNSLVKSMCFHCPSSKWYITGILVVLGENIFIVKENQGKIWLAVSLLGISAVDSYIGKW